MTHVLLSLAAQIAFFFYMGEGRKGSGTLTKDFLAQHSPGLGLPWVLITSVINLILDSGAINRIQQFYHLSASITSLSSPLYK